MAKTKEVPVPEVGTTAPEFRLPAAQGGQLKLAMRTVRGPVIVVFFRGLWSEEDVEYFTALAGKEDEINTAGATVVGIGVTDPPTSREFVRRTGIHSYVLYDSALVAVRDYGLAEKDSDHGETARPAAFLVAKEGEIVESWTGERPDPAELLAKVTAITGLPKAEEEGEEAEAEKKPRARRRKQAAEEDAAGAESEEKAEAKPEAESGAESGAETGAKAAPAAETAGETAGEEKPEQKKVSPEEREKRRAERKAAREKAANEDDAAAGGEAASGEAAGSGEEAKSGEGSDEEKPG